MISHTNQARKAFTIHLQTLLVKNNCRNGFHSSLVQLCAMVEAQIHQNKTTYALYMPCCMLCCFSERTLLHIENGRSTSHEA